MKEMEEIREELAAIKTDICWIKKTLNNHLKHHWTAEIGLILALLGVILKFLLFR